MWNEYTLMKDHRRQAVLWVFPLVLGLGACASKSASSGLNDSSHEVSPGPPGPEATVSASSSSSSEPLPDDKFGDVKMDQQLKSPITPLDKDQEKKEADLFDALTVTGTIAAGGGKGNPQKARGHGDPLTSGGETALAAAPVPPREMGEGGSATFGRGSVGAASEMRGTIEKKDIQRVVKDNVKDVQRCYEQGLMTRLDLRGRLVVKFVVGRTGTVAGVTITETELNEHSVEQCIISAALKWTFPKPTGEGLASFSYPFILKPGN